MAATALGLAVALHFLARSPLWLDEAQSVAIARQPLYDLAAALRLDGSPPLYYVLLHGWMEVFGAGTFAVRALSGVLSIVALPLAFVLGRRLVGATWAGWAAALVLATMPWSVRYATEARMYSLVVVLVLLLALAVDAVRRRPGILSLAAVSLVSGLLLLTHYTSFYLLGVLAAALASGAARAGAPRRWTRHALLGVCAGALLFLPWVPAFLYQRAHTGTPWAVPPPWRALPGVVGEWAGSAGLAGVVLGGLYWLLLLAGATGAPSDGWRVTLDLRGRSPGRLLAGAAVLTLTLMLVAARNGVGAFAVRYTAVLVPVAVAVIVLGVAALPPGRPRLVVLSLVVVLGLVESSYNVTASRTQAGQVAEALEVRSQPSDVVAYCPDQLGPAVRRLLPDGPRQLTYPSGADPVVVDWVDYAAKQAAGSPAMFAARAKASVGPGGALWLVAAPGYPALSGRCEQLVDRLTDAYGAPQTVVALQPWSYERMSLLRWSASSMPATAASGRSRP
jgi:mannosyltransferase